MGKYKKPTNLSAPTEKNISTRSKTLRKKSINESIDGQNKFFLEEPAFLQKDKSGAQAKSKYFPYNEDIDIYFASCFNSNYKIKDESHQLFEKESTTEKSSKETKKPNIVLLKQDMLEEVAQSLAQSSEANFEEANDSQKQRFEHDCPDSPIFGQKMLKNLRTPPHKLEELKIIDQSEEIAKKELMDQLEDVSKDVSSSSDNQPNSPIPTNNMLNNIDVASPVFKTEKRISKEKRMTSNKKKAWDEDYFTKHDSRQFSFKRNDSNEEIRRRSEIIRLSSLRSIHSNYDRSERFLLSLDNAIKSLMNYYNLRELNPKLLNFRNNIFKTCRQFFFHQEKRLKG